VSDDSKCHPPKNIKQSSQKCKSIATFDFEEEELACQLNKELKHDADDTSDSDKYDVLPTICCSPYAYPFSLSGFV
jgi:hypothetical protein